MAKFDQRNQQVENQINVDGNIFLGGHRKDADLVEKLVDELKELITAMENISLPDSVAIDTRKHLQQALEQAQDQDNEGTGKTIVEHLQEAKMLLGGLREASALISGLMTASDIARRLFL